MAIDQTVFSTTNLFMFLSSMSLMEGTDPREKLQKSYKTALIKNWTVWPAVQAINFKLVPLEHRVLVVNVVSLGKSSAQTTTLRHHLIRWLLRMELLSQLY